MALRERRISNCVEGILTGPGSWSAPRTTRASPAMTGNGAAEIWGRLESSFMPGLPLAPPP